MRIETFGLLSVHNSNFRRTSEAQVVAHYYPDLQKFLVAVDIVWENAIRGNECATEVSFFL